MVGNGQRQQERMLYHIFGFFNPTTQSEKFDPSGNFIRKYVQELAGVPNKFIHQPEKMTVKEQTEFKLILGEDYSFPIVDHQERRKAAIARYEFSKTYASQNL